LRKGYSRIGASSEDINTAIENAGKLEICVMLGYHFQEGPMTGLGTVVGMIQAFHKMATASGQQKLAHRQKVFTPQ
jgi:biopolymer transport protein ExbB